MKNEKCLSDYLKKLDIEIEMLKKTIQDNDLFDVEIVKKHLKKLEEERFAVSKYKKCAICDFEITTKCENCPACGEKYK